MADQIDLSAGMVPNSAPAAAPSTSGIDLSAGFVPKATAPDTYAHYGMDAKGKISNRQMQAAKDYDTDKGNFVPNMDTSGDMIDNSYKPSNEALKSVGVDPDAYRGNKSVAIKTALTGGALPQMDHNGNITGGTTGINPVKAVRSAITAIPRAVGGIWNAAVDPVTAQEQQSPVLNNSTTGAEAHRGPALMAKRLLVDPQVGEIQKAVGSWQQGNYADAAAHGIGGAVPLVGPLAANVAEGLTSGSGDEQADAIGNLGGALVVPEALSKASDVLPKSVPRSALSKTIKPADPVAFNAAEQSALPQIKQAAIESGQPIKSASDLLTTVDPKTGTTKLGLIDKAKQNILLDGDNAAGEDKNFDELPPDQLAKANQQLKALDNLKKHISDAQEAANKKTAPAPPSTPGIAADILGTVSPRAAHAMNLAGKASDILSILKGKRSLTPENLDAAVQQTFGKVEPAGRGDPVPVDVAEKEQAQPVTGDLSVQHQGNIQPPELPHGNATVSPDRPNPAVISSGSTAQPLVTKPAAIGPNVPPPVSTTQLDSTLPKPSLPTETAPPVKQPLTSSTPQAQLSEVLKKAGVQKALKDAGVAAPSATVRQIRPGIDIGPTLQPRMDLTFYGDKTGEGAALMQLTRYNINELRSMAVQRGLDVAPGDSHLALIDKIHDDLSPEEIKEFNDAAAERGISPRATQPKRGYKQPPAAASAQPQAEPQEPPASAAAPQTDRRQNLDLREAVDSMSPEDQVKAIYQHEGTGMPNERAFDWAQQKFGPAKSVAMTDADGLKAFNDTYGHEAGNALLKAKADALREAGVEGYYKQGDEFLARGDSSADLSAKLEKARDILQNTVIRVTDADGKIHEYTGADFSYGTGADMPTAEQGMYDMKAKRKASGDAGERGQFGKIKEIK